MPSYGDKPISDLADELLRRELNRDPEQFKEKKFDLGLDSNGSEMKPISPDKLHTIGGLADAASTYAFLKRGKAKEGNALMGFAGGHPEVTALGALGGLAATKGITALIRKVNPKVADAVSANLGALQSAYSVSNLGIGRGIKSSRDYQNSMINKVIEGK